MTLSYEAYLAKLPENFTNKLYNTPGHIYTAGKATPEQAFERLIIATSVLIRIKHIHDKWDNTGVGKNIVNMSIWGEHEVSDDEPYHEPTEHFCGTTACALGHLALSPEMRALGMDSYWMPGTIDTKYNPYGEDHGGWVAKRLLRVFGSYSEPMNGARDFFDLEVHETAHLFGGGEHGGIGARIDVLKTILGKKLVGAADNELREQLIEAQANVSRIRSVMKDILCDAYTKVSEFS